MNWSLVHQWILDVGALATFGTLLVLWRQLRAVNDQGRTTFEDSLAREYRELAHKIPVRAFLGHTLSEEEHRVAMPSFFQYVDLSNEQVFLRLSGRVSDVTWASWAEGIQKNLDRPAFKRAWDEIKTTAPSSFGELRRLEREGFREDPSDWPEDEH